MTQFTNYRANTKKGLKSDIWYCRFMNVDPITDFTFYFYTYTKFSWHFSKMIPMILFSLALSLSFQIHFGECLTLSELFSNPPDQGYFTKYGQCSISASRMQDAYLVEGKLAATIIKGLNNVDTKKVDYIGKDEELKKEMYHIMSRRTLENAAKNFTNNPINALNFLTRVVTHFNPILNSIFTSVTLMKRIFHKDLSAVVDRYIREDCSCWPTSKDIFQVLKSISKISSTYNISKKELVEGFVGNETSFEPLSLEQVVALIHEANRNNYFEDVLEWTKYILENKNISAEEEQSTWQSIVKIKASAYFKKNEIKEAISYLQEIIKEVKFDPKTLTRDLHFYQSKLNENIKIKSDEKEQLYNNLCRQEEKFNKDIGLRCFYRQVGTHWDRVKVERISQSPPAFKYYNVVKEENILQLYNLMKKLKIKMSAHQEKGAVITDAKLSREIGVVWDDDYLITKYLSQRISYLTGLDVKTYKHNTKMSSSSPFQILNYGIGGYVDAHTDYLAQDKDDSRKDISAFGGDRMATWMYQLSDKVQGGHLVFVKSNITVSLQKGSAVLLFNIFTNGTINPLAEYMECPVILGSKWIGTKHIHEHGNMFKRRCQRNKKTFF